MRKHAIQAFTIGLVILLSSGIFLSTINDNGAYAKTTNDEDSAYWKQIAKNAWNYFSLNIGVSATTGLPYANNDCPYYTDWDLACYIQAIIAAEKAGVLSRTGAWGADDRINKVLTCLETRPRMSDGLPYVWYSSDTNDVWSDRKDAATATDAGKLFIALTALKTYNPTLKTRIDTLVYNTTNYEARRYSVDILLPEYKQGTRIPNLYDYYVTRGFALFWPERFNAEATGMLDFIFSGNKTQYNGVTLPHAKITCDPILMCMFELENNDPRIVSLSHDIYLAQEARYNATGHYTAFSEGNTGYNGLYSFIYQWIILGDGRMWAGQYNDNYGLIVDIPISPIIFFKSAISMHALYETSYTQKMVDYLTSQMPSPYAGYVQGVDEDGRVLYSVNAGVGNALILEAANYALEEASATPTPTPTPTSTATPKPTPSPTPIATPTPTPTSTPSTSPTPTPNPSPTPTVTPTPTPTSTSTPTATPTSTSISTVIPTQTSTPTPQPTTTPSINPTNSSTQNPTAAPTPTIPELTVAIVLFFAITTTLLAPLILKKSKVHNSALEAE